MLEEIFKFNMGAHINNSVFSQFLQLFHLFHINFNEDTKVKHLLINRHM